MKLYDHTDNPSQKSHIETLRRPQLISPNKPSAEVSRRKIGERQVLPSPAELRSTVTPYEKGGPTDTVTTRGDQERAEMYRSSVERHAEKELREAAQVAWSLYHEHMAELHTRLAVEHRIKAARIREDGSR
jgi:hypothetical protein